MSNHLPDIKNAAFYECHSYLHLLEDFLTVGLSYLVLLSL